MPLLTEQQAIERMSWSEFQDFIIDKVEVDEGFITVSSDGTQFGFSTKHGSIPKVGDLVRRYSRNGYAKGIDINESPVYFLTEEEMDEERRKWAKEQENKEKEVFKKNKKKLDEQYRLLPSVFKKRIRWFRKHNPDFRWKYESYEMLVCIDAIKIAEKCATPEAVREFMHSSWDFQKTFVPELNEGHSGNSFGMACRLAYNYLEDEEMVFFEHGALTTLVGCAEYGCAHPRPGVEKFAKEKGWNE